jgi:hypothetical protein
MKLGLCDLHAACVFYIPLINFLMPEPIFMKLISIYVMSPEPVLAAYFINPFHQSVCLYVYPHIVASQ